MEGGGKGVVDGLCGFGSMVSLCGVENDLLFWWGDGAKGERADCFGDTVGVFTRRCGLRIGGRRGGGGESMGGGWGRW